MKPTPFRRQKLGDNLREPPVGVCSPGRLSTKHYVGVMLREWPHPFEMKRTAFNKDCHMKSTRRQRPEMTGGEIAMADCTPSIDRVRKLIQFGVHFTLG